MKRNDDTNLDEELASLLAGDLDDEADDEAEAEYRLMQSASFDVAVFVDKLRATEGVLINHQAIDVPLDAAKLEAQAACVLCGLELAVDDQGHPYLIGAVVAEDEQVVIVSRSFVEVDSDEEEGE